MEVLEETASGITPAEVVRLVARDVAAINSIPESTRFASQADFRIEPVGCACTAYSAWQSLHTPVNSVYVGTALSRCHR